jgi:AbiV family abortive infection protein
MAIMSKAYDLTEQDLKNGCARCIVNVLNLLDTAKLLLNNESSCQYALGLYIYAIEEYGKVEILKNYLKEGNNNNGRYSIPIWVFGKGDDARKGHWRKLSEAFKKLPPAVGNCQKK